MTMAFYLFDIILATAYLILPFVDVEKNFRRSTRNSRREKAGGERGKKTMN